MKPYRLQFKFWLDVNKPDERHIAKVCENLKDERLFARTIRNALRLFIDLKRGNVDVLLELFPHVRDALAPSEAATSSASGQGRGIAPHAENDTIQAHLVRLERLLLQQGNIPSDTGLQRVKSSSNDDIPNAADLIEVSAAKADKLNNSGYNLIIAATIQNIGHCNGLGAEIRAYGVATKRISKSHLTPENYALALAGGVTATKPTPAAATVTAGQGAPKQIALPKSFTPSSLNDDDDLSLFD